MADVPMLRPAGQLTGSGCGALAEFEAVVGAEEEEEEEEAAAATAAAWAWAAAAAWAWALAEWEAEWGAEDEYMSVERWGL